jgi:hypothetical protein
MRLKLRYVPPPSSLSPLSNPSLTQVQAQMDSPVKVTTAAASSNPAPRLQRLVLPPINSQQFLDLEGGALSPLASPKKPSPRPHSDKSLGSDGHTHSSALHISPAAASVDNLL